MWRSSGSTLSSLQMLELLTLSPRLSPATICHSFQFSHYPELMTIGEGWLLMLPLQLMHPGHFNSFTWDNNSLPTWRDQSTIFQQRTWSMDEGQVWWSQQNHLIWIKQRCNSEVPKLNWLHLEILSMNITNRIEDKGQPLWSPTPTENVFDLVPRIQTPAVASTGFPGVHVVSLLQVHKTYRLARQTSMAHYSNPARVKSWSTLPQAGQNPHCSSWISVTLGLLSRTSGTRRLSSMILQ